MVIFIIHSSRVNYDLNIKFLIITEYYYYYKIFLDIYLLFFQVLMIKKQVIAYN